MKKENYYQNLFKQRGKSNKKKILSLLNHFLFKKNFLIFHVGGTNGKGSVSYYLSQGFKEKYSKIGLYTSPHIISINERIKINGKNISDEDLYKYCSKITDIDPKISFVSLMYIVAMLYFFDNKIDIAVLEVGIGGRYDDTNLIHGEYGTLTSIGLDHTKILGNTIEEIAKDKAGIMYKDMLYFIPSFLNDNIKEILHNEANLSDSKIIEILIAHSDYQKQNMTLAQNILKYFKIYKSKFNTPFGRSSIVCYRGINHILDVAHNYDAIKEALRYLKVKNIKYDNICISLSNDKDIENILILLKDYKNIFVYQNSNSRSRNIDEYNIGKKISNIKFFINDIKTSVLFIGSFFLIADVMEVINEKNI